MAHSDPRNDIPNNVQKSHAALLHLEKYMSFSHMLSKTRPRPILRQYAAMECVGAFSSCIARTIHRGAAIHRCLKGRLQEANILMRPATQTVDQSNDSRIPLVLRVAVR